LERGLEYRILSWKTPGLKPLHGIHKPGHVCLCASGRVYACLYSCNQSYVGVYI